jgi:nitrate reductase gamma subunit/ferredoxin
MMYIFFLVSLLIFGYGIYRHISFWKAGKADPDRFSQPLGRILTFIKAIFTQKKTFNTAYPGIFHALIFYSFLVLVLTTTVILLDYDFGASLFTGRVYLVLSMASEAAGVLILIGIAMALWRRHVIKPKTLDISIGDTVWLVVLAVIVITGYVIEGLRIGVAGDPWQWSSPVGCFFSAFFVPFSANDGKTLHAVSWWAHTVLVMAWIAVIPYTKFFHILVVPVNAYFGKIKPAGELSRIDIQALMENEDMDEEDFNIGIGRTTDFTWKQRMDLTACLSCGRCEAVCPASMAGQPLSPKTFIQNMRDLIGQTKGEVKNNRDQKNCSMRAK